MTTSPEREPLRSRERTGPHAAHGRWRFGVLVALGLVGAAAAAEADDRVPQAVFDARVSDSRRSLRQACRASERLIAEAGEAVPGLERRAEKSVGAALERWNALAREFVSTVPAGYTGDPAWGRRLEDVRRDLSRMKDEVEVRDFRSAVLSCRRVTCALGEMHEANGVSLAIDRVAELRRKTAYVRGLVLAGKEIQIPPLIPSLLLARDAVRSTPPPARADRQEYSRLLRRLSRGTDALAAAARVGDDLGLPIEQLRVVVDELYDEAL